MTRVTEYDAETAVILEEIGARLAAARHALKLSRPKAADLTGVHEAVLGSYERADRSIPAVVLVRIARAYGMDPRDLVGDPTPQDAMAALGVVRAALTRRAS